MDLVSAEEKFAIVRKNLISFNEEYQTKSASSLKSSTTLTPDELLKESPLETNENDVNNIFEYLSLVLVSLIFFVFVYSQALLSLAIASYLLQKVPSQF